MTHTTHRLDNTPLLPAGLYGMYTTHKGYSCYTSIVPSRQEPLDLFFLPPLQNSNTVNVFSPNGRVGRLSLAVLNSQCLRNRMQMQTGKALDTKN